MRVIVVIIITFITSSLFAQDNNALDTTVCSRYSVVIKLPLNLFLIHRTSIFTYEEGFFKAYPTYRDSAHVTIHYGSMVDRPFCLQQYDNVSYQIVQDDKKYKVIMGRFKNTYFREDYHKQTGITVSYDCVTDDLLPTFNDILDNIKIFPSRNE